MGGVKRYDTAPVSTQLHLSPSPRPAGLELETPSCLLETQRRAARQPQLPAGRQPPCSLHPTPLPSSTHPSVHSPTYTHTHTLDTDIQPQ